MTPPCPETTRLFEARMDARAERQATYRNQLGAAAYRLGRQVRAHRVTIDDAHAQLARLVDRLDPEVGIRVRLIPYDEARLVVRKAFAHGMRQGGATA